MSIVDLSNAWTVVLGGALVQCLFVVAFAFHCANLFAERSERLWRRKNVYV